MSALLTDSLPLLTGAPNGIQKLRELILELAVRGKLVPQDSKDEPANELLRQITEEKMQLVAKGKVSLTPIDEADTPYKAVSGWLWIKLGDISLIERGGSPRPIKDFLTESADGLNWIKIGDTDKGGKYITSAGEKIRREGLTKTRMVYPGDFLLTNSMSFGRPYITQIEGCIHDGWLRISPPDSLVKDYLYLLLSSPYVRGFFVQAAAGAVVLNLNADKVRELPVPLPPLAEQHRIVAKVDELMALCDRLEARQADAESAHAQLVQALLDSLTQPADAADFAASWQHLADYFHTLFTTESSINALKQTLLQLAVMGKLVPQDPNDEPAIVLLKRIAKEKVQLMADGKIKKQKPLTEVLDEKQPFDLPEGWLSVYLADAVALVTDGDHQPPPKALEGVPFLVIGNLSTGNIQFDGCRRVPHDYFEALDWGRKPSQGDLLYTVTGSFGIPIAVDVDDPFCVQRHVAIIKTTVSTSSEYLKVLLGSRYAKRYAESIATGIAQKTVPLSGLRKLVIPLPPLPEQHRIVAKVDQLMALCEQLKARLNQARQLNEQLASALIEQAVA